MGRYDHNDMPGCHGDTGHFATVVRLSPHVAGLGPEESLLGELTLRLEQDYSILPTLASDSDDLAAVVDTNRL